MATYQTKKCPKCGRIYERNSYVGNPSKENRTKYGSPIKQCGFCGAVFVDNEYREIEIEGIREVDQMKISPQTMVMCAIGIIIGIACVGNGVNGGLIFIGISGVVLLLEYLEYGKRQKILEKQAEESKQRLENPVYALTLQKLGYDVPQKYILKEKDPIRCSMENLHFTFIPERGAYKRPSSEEIYPLVEVSKFLLQHGFIFCCATTGDGISEILHTGDAPYNVKYKDFQKFYTNFADDFFTEQKNEEERSGGWISSLNYGYVAVYLKRAHLLFRATVKCDNVTIEWYEHTEQDSEFINNVNDEMRRILIKCRQDEGQVGTEPNVTPACWD